MIYYDIGEITEQENKADTSSGHLNPGNYFTKEGFLYL